MDITDRLRRPLVSHATPEQMPDRQLARQLVDDRSDALIEIERLRRERDDLASFLRGIGKQASDMAKSYTSNLSK